MAWGAEVIPRFVAILPFALLSRIPRSQLPSLMVNFVDLNCGN
jgi:hypothetical protein